MKRFTGVGGHQTAEPLRPDDLHYPDHARPDDDAELCCPTGALYGRRLGSASTPLQLTVSVWSFHPGNAIALGLTTLALPGGWAVYQKRSS